MSKITLKVNGGTHTVDVDPSTPLLYVLRNDLGLTGPRFGCGLGQCGACTVIINGVATRSCITPIDSIDKSEITTIEEIGATPALQFQLHEHRATARVVVVSRDALETERFVEIDRGRH